MLLQFIIGRSGTGKTQTVYENMRRLAADTAPVFLLVPEQASFENERRLLTEFGPVLSQRVQVLSFTRMAETVFRSIGGLAGKTMDTTLSLLFMSQALHTVADSLTIYRRHADSADYLNELLSFLSECKQCAITPQQLQETADSLPENTLRAKLQETALIFTAYEALTAQSHVSDPLDMLTVLARRLPDCHLFDGAHIFVDSFVGFTRQEFSILEHLVARAASVTVALCTDTLAQTNRFGIFSAACHTATQLRDIAYKHGAAVTAPQVLTKNHRTASLALQAVEAGCCYADCAPFTEPTEDVCITPCADRTEECRYVARQIRRLLRENGGFSRDFTVVSRNSNDYRDALQTALQREGLSCIMDMREPVLTQPLIVLLESALAVIRRGWDSADVLRLIKTGLLGFSTASSSLLENYVFIWNVRGKQWKALFTNHPDGLTATADTGSERRLAYLNLLRHRLIEPLVHFELRLSAPCNGRDFAEAVWHLLSEWRVPRIIRFQAARFSAAGEHVLAENQARLWDYTIALLDKFAFALTEKTLTVNRLADLFHLAVSSDDLGNIPSALDGVVFGGADRIRYTEPKTVFVLGANEGVFPAYPPAGGIITDHERQLLTAAGLPIANNPDSRSVEERFFVYAALSAASQRLIITYSQKVNGEPQQPSSLVDLVSRVVPQHQTGNPADSVCESVDDAFYHLTTLWQSNTSAAASYRHVFAELPAYAERVEAMEQYKNGFAFREAETGRRLFGEHLRLSPSQIEVFHRCRFAYFCQYGLRAKPRKPAELNAALAGTLVHYVMQQLLPQYVEKGMELCTESTVSDDAARTVAEYVRKYMTGANEKDGRFDNLIVQLSSLCSQLLWRVVCEFKNSAFVPTDFELPIGRYDENGNGIPPWILKTENGTTVQVQGTVDRVDTFKKDGRTYLRIVDYKTGAKVFDMVEICAGLNLQMLIYLFSICKNGQSRYGDITPAGVLYLPAKLPVTRIEGNTPPAVMERERLKTMKMNGLLLDQPDVLEAMEKENGGLFIPVSFTASGISKMRSSLASLEQFSWIEQHIQNLLLQMAKLLHSGNIEALPVSGITDGCQYCDYHDICGHEPEDTSRVLTKKSLQEALAELKPEQKEE